MKVLVAMSGGVDSSVAAALLVEAGHDVTGVHLKLADVPLAEQVPGQGCCTLDDAQDARRVAQVLAIPFYVWDLSEVFRREVQDPFAAGYASGSTPNPCVTCNERVKYAALLERATRLGFDALATGHHVRLRRGEGDDAEALAPVTSTGPGVRLFRAADPRKDQTYVLYVATPDQLARSLFPVGELTKAEVRREAERRGLRVAGKPDSYDVCFVPDGDTAAYLADRLPPAPGDVVDLDGEAIGRHDGAWRFTVGQRRGLGLGTHERRFVVDVDAQRRQVVVGPREALACRWLEIDRPNWVGGSPPDTEEVAVQIRAHARAIPARLSRCVSARAEYSASALTQRGERWRVEVEEPLYGVARGQAAVIYRRDGLECLGGGTVVAAQRPVHSRS